MNKLEELNRLRERLSAADDGMTDLRDDEIAILRQNSRDLTEHEKEILATLPPEESR